MTGILFHLLVDQATSSLFGKIALFRNPSLSLVLDSLVCQGIGKMVTFAISLISIPRVILMGKLTYGTQLLAKFERKGTSQTSNREVEDFNLFLQNAGLHDLPLLGCKYTWINCDGTSMSRIDRFLISEGWLSIWPNTVQKGLSRSISDHCPIIVNDKTLNWGPKPFRSLDCLLV